MANTGGEDGDGSNPHEWIPLTADPNDDEELDSLTAEMMDTFGRCPYCDGLTSLGDLVDPIADGCESCGVKLEVAIRPADPSFDPEAAADIDAFDERRIDDAPQAFEDSSN